ncbi:hypothetical protein [Synechococcus sp. PCC 6312]|uniref:hypothetical protein n=1 Tax=Synechococcus sp. (strain ATCC 27167 / PCC 6312) TaxID=195253 RepID=UPI00029ECDAB|nr:hypothetical protein [Synechococcus sp. PCC 6312]AFY60416.1 hypothetical protein Syn6312_1234 [Synechococcus sp. PCC 6312]
MSPVALTPSAPAAASPAQLAQEWAKRYVRNLNDPNQALIDDPATVAKKLQADLRQASVQAWNRTEGFLGAELRRHDIAAELIDPWDISKDIHDIYQQTLILYRDGKTPDQLTMTVGPTVGQVRRKHTAIDPRVIGFVSLQFHHTGVILLQNAPASQRETLQNFFKVIDDHLYMPLHRAYEAAANHDYNSPGLSLVRHLLPESTAIATTICQRVAAAFQSHRCFTGPLNHPQVRTSSIRDVEMFQIYLWVCLLEGSLDAIQRELFPLCLMLYPTLNVTWELVYQMVYLLGTEIKTRTTNLDSSALTPYYQALREMFNPKIFQGV